MSEGPIKPKKIIEGAGESKIGSSPEAPLSPETVEKIMEKVQDIDTEGLAYSRIPSFSTEAMKKIFQEGLLGVDFRKSGGISAGHKGITKESWVRSARGHSPIIHFNIVGRERGYYSRNKKREVYRSSIGGSYYSGPGAVFVVFNPSKFKEVEVETARRVGSGLPEISHKFEPNSYVTARELYNTEIGRIVDDEHGFLLSSRVAPRFFQGIVFCPEREYDPDEINHIKYREVMDALRKSIKEHDRLVLSYKRQIDEYKAKKQVTDLIRFQMEADAGKPELLNPIYDTEGNLWWPKQMSYEEVKKLVAERAGNGGGETESEV